MDTYKQLDLRPPEGSLRAVDPEEYNETLSVRCKFERGAWRPLSLRGIHIHQTNNGIIRVQAFNLTKQIKLTCGSLNKGN